MLYSASSAGIVAKFSTIAGGVWIEQQETPLGMTRAWRFDKRGCSEWADAAGLDNMPRWYGHQFKARDFVLC
jgi:hypothetical protein